jgi:hypothetical protein
MTSIKVADVPFLSSHPGFAPYAVRPRATFPERSRLASPPQNNSLVCGTLNFSQPIGSADIGHASDTVQQVRDPASAILSEHHKRPVEVGGRFCPPTARGDFPTREPKTQNLQQRCTQHQYKHCRNSLRPLFPSIHDPHRPPDAARYEGSDDCAKEESQEANEFQIPRYHVIMSLSQAGADSSTVRSAGRKTIAITPSNSSGKKIP